MYNIYTLYMPRKKTIDYIPTEAERKAYHWCINRNIKVHVKPRGIQFILVSEIDGVGRSSGKKYMESEIFSKQWGYYLYLYEKLNND